MNNHLAKGAIAMKIENWFVGTTTDIVVSMLMCLIIGGLVTKGLHAWIDNDNGSMFKDLKTAIVKKN